MTRFARAKGSKASNEKAPEDGTPWEVMKEQLVKAKQESEDSKKRHEAEQQRIANYENFLKEQKVQKRPATWCDFPEEDNGLKNKTKQNAPVQEHSPKKKKKKQKLAVDGDVEVIVKEGDESKDTEKLSGKKKKNKQSQEQLKTSALVSGTTNSKNKKKNKKHKSQSINNSTSVEENEIKTTPVSKDLTKVDNSVTLNAADEPGGEGNIKKQKKKKKKTKVAKSLDEPGTKDVENNNEIINKQNKQKAKKKKKLVDGQAVRRKEINDRSFQLIINGKEIELVRFDGFPIMKKDAERLSELKNSMMKKGIPKSEVQRTMKLERRRAEKALARLKREVCYNCRKGGHNLSDCPELKSKIPGVDAAEGVCFKCGSTEHRQFECKVQRDKEFRFATCFICKEPGHIASQCPDNPKGLYPNGGSCKLCGDVTHLRKDCPTANNKKEESSMKLQTLESSDNIEDIAVQSKTTTFDDSIKKPKKIKF